jgi:hypothetical protein
MAPGQTTGRRGEPTTFGGTTRYAENRIRKRATPSIQMHSRLLQRKRARASTPGLPGEREKCRKKRLQRNAREGCYRIIPG